MFFIVALHLLWLPASMAQQGFHIGINGSLNGTFILGQNNYEALAGSPIIPQSLLAYRFTLGYSAGITAGYNFNKRLGIVTSVTYNKAGQHYNDNFHPGGNVVRNIDLNYLQVPVLFKYTFGPYYKMVQVYAMTGPEIGILVNGKEEIWANDIPKTNLLPISRKYKKLDIGWAFGAGTDIYVTHIFYVEAGLLGFISLIDINNSAVKKNNWFSDNDVKYRASYNFNPGINIGAHYLFNEKMHKELKDEHQSPFKMKLSPRPAPKVKDEKGNKHAFKLKNKGKAAPKVNVEKGNKYP